jgi:hypothetical protein
MAIANYKSFITRLGKMICKNFTDSEFVKTEFDDEFNSNTAYFTINGYSAWACIYDDDDVITVYVASTHTVEIKIDGTQKDAMATAVRRIESLLDEAEIKKAEIDKKAEEEVNADKQEAEEPQPTPEETDREVTYIDFKPEQDYSEEEPKVENSKVKAAAQYLSNKITGWYENARIDYGVNGKFLSCKAEGENGIRINWEEEGKEYTMVINWFTEYTTEHLYNIWMEQGVEVEEVEKQPKEEDQQVVTIDNTQLFLKNLTKSFDAAGFATSYKELYQGTYSIHAIADQGVMVDVGFNEGVPCKTSASAVVYSGTDCIIIDCTKYNTETEFIKAIIEKVISASIKEKELFSKATKFFESTDSTDNKVRKLRKEFKQWELLQEREKEADEAYEANYKNKELEKAADEAFEAEYKQYDKIARMIAELINVEVLTAKSMLTNRAERVKKILGL